MPERIVIVKKSGASKNNPEKFGWVLGDDEKFYNVSRAQADSAVIGGQYKQVYHINQKGYEQTDSFAPVAQNGAPVNGSPGNGTPLPHSYKDLDIATQAVYKASGILILSRNYEGEITKQIIAEALLLCEDGVKLWWRSRNKAAPTPPPAPTNIEDTF